MEAHVVQLILCGAWITGLLLLGVSLQATRMLNDPSPAVVQQQDRSLRVTLYSAPLPFEGVEGIRQAVAVNSWLKLSPCPQIVLLGQHPSLFSFASSLGPNVTVERQIDFTFGGSPFFHTMVSRARASDADVAVLVDPDQILLQDLMEAVDSMQKLKGDWLLVAVSRSVPDFPFSLDSPSSMWSGEGGELVDPGEVLEYVTENGVWDECGGSRVWVWNVGAVPLHAGVMPPFVFRQGQHNEWLLNEALSSGFRAVVDGSEAVSVINPLRLPNASSQPWEAESNSQFSALYGSFLFRRANFSSIPVKLVQCGVSLCFLKASEKEVPCVSQMGRRGLDSPRGSLLRLSLPVTSASTRQLASQDSHWKGSGFWDEWIIERPRRQSAGRGCNAIPRDRKLQCPASSSMEKWGATKSNLSMPLTLVTMASAVANQDKVIILTVVGNSYRAMLMSWVCRLRVLGISNFLISALDDELYQYAVQQGLPVLFRDGPTMNVSRNDCHFGTKCFQKVTKMKSKTVLQVLQLGYHVLFSDVDVYWFEDPVPKMMSYGPGYMAAQTDQYNSSAPANEPRRLNSGFYFARSDEMTIAAFEMIVRHAASSNMSEQPSFYDVLCGEEGKYRVGEKECKEPHTGLTVHFMDRDQFPNGAHGSIWEKKDVKEDCQKRSCIILHNNWISSRLKKVHRQILKGLWQYDMSSRMCLRSWQGPNSLHSY